MPQSLKDIEVLDAGNTLAAGERGRAMLLILELLQKRRYSCEKQMLKRVYMTYKSAQDFP